MRYLLAFTLSLIVSLMATPVAVKLAEKLGIIDRPTSDRWHKRATPRMGGIAIFAGFIVASTVFGPLQRETLIVLLGGLGIFTLGLLDDKFGTFPKTKFIVQLGIALVLVLFGVRLRILPTVAAVPLTLVWIVAIINAFNLIDNIDGLSAGVAFIASIAFFLFSWDKHGQAVVPILALALAGACLGFLRYNFNPATIFMGDGGSLFLGYILSSLAILEFWQKASPVLPTLTAPVLILGYPIFDTTFVTILRLKAGGRPWVGGKDHSSHRLVKLGLSEKKAVLLLYALGIVGGLYAFVVLNTAAWPISALLAAFCILAVAFGFILAKA